MITRTAFALLVLATCVAACRPSPSPTPPPAASESQAATTQASAPFGGTLAPVQRTRSLPPSVARPTLRGVQVGPGPSAGYDRVVFEFAGDSVPGYHVRYTTAPAQRCGSGDRVAVAGTGRLLVRFEPAEAHEAQRHWTPGLPAVRELTLICDFEGQVEWVLGTAQATPYRVAELRAPARVVLDVSH